MIITTLGGATVWPLSGISVFPIQGSAVVWYNLSRDGELDQLTHHRACSVILGNKWIANKWIAFVEQWQESKYKCGLSASRIFTSNSLIG